MALSAKFIRAQLNLLKPFVTGCSLEVARKTQDALGDLMAASHKRKVSWENHSFGVFEGTWITPKTQTKQGIILYLHGGGYTCGSLEYAKGFGTTLSAECGMQVFCAAYRLAPEHRYPAALDDALSAYSYLLASGFASSEIILCGESAGGGLIFALCLKLKEQSLPLPGGLIAISPWSDLTSSGVSYEQNKEIDPSMTKERLQFYADCYTDNKMNPFASPLFGDLKHLPPSLIFVGGDEIMLDDARLLHKKLRDSGGKSQLVVAPGMWHGYVLYGLKENKTDFLTINAFLEDALPATRKLRWMRLDNAAKIFPASRRKNWSNVFRISATLTEKIDVDVLKDALSVTVKRFPSIAVRLRRGMFWYYFEELPKAPEILAERSYPLTRMSKDEIRKCGFRVLTYRNRIAVEFFHALTDGSGGLVFLKTLVAEYLTQKYGITIPASNGVLNRKEEPSDEELEDSFLKYQGDATKSRREPTAYHITGAMEPDRFLHVTTLMMDVSETSKKAKAYGVSLTTFLCAVMIAAITQIQDRRVPNKKRQRPVRVLIPVNLRKLFNSKSLRNYASYITPGIDPKLGEYSFAEICKTVHHQMGIELTAKQMRAKITTNVKSEQALIVKILPLFMKNIAMKTVFDMLGECKSCLCLSNLGAIALPKEMKAYVARMDLILGVQAKAPYNCGVLSYDDTLYINFIRNIKEPILEMQFYNVLKSFGLHVKVESNQR